MGGSKRHGPPCLSTPASSKQRTAATRAASEPVFDAANFSRPTHLRKEAVDMLCAMAPRIPRADQRTANAIAFAQAAKKRCELKNDVYVIEAKYAQKNGDARMIECINTGTVHRANWQFLGMQPMPSAWRPVLACVDVELDQKCAHWRIVLDLLDAGGYADR
jgi:hypothetical protein